ncbi:MAG: FISUMP domain-containing protein [Arcobacteraceae bacterium]|nr:FISUMP domain-containing protein [Arcobacteraceae bacterium]
MSIKFHKPRLSLLNPKVLVSLATTSLLLTGCGGGGGGTTPAPDPTSVDITLVDGYIKDANITDANGLQATQVNGTIGLYRFSTTPTYPIKMIVGNAKLTDTNATFDINLTAYSGTVISPITTIIGNDTTIQNNLLATMNITSGVLSRDYVDVNDTDVAKLSQLCYAMLKDTNATTKFKTRLQTRTENNITALIDKAITEDSNTSANQDGIVNFLTTLKTHTGSVKDFERDLQAKKNTISFTPTTLTWNTKTYKTILSQTTNKVWLDRNLGATQVCTSSTDTACYGDYYQWGRETDGHQVSNSVTTGTLENDLNTTGNSSFILNNSGTYDWTTLDSNGSLRSANWSKTDESSVCPVGYRVPTEAELTAETISNSADAFTKLKLPSAGYRYGDSGSLYSQGSWGGIWSSSPDGSSSKHLYFGSSDVGWEFVTRAYGSSVRCIKN